MSVIWGIATIVGMLVVHRHRVLSPWLLLGIIPCRRRAPLDAGLFRLLVPLARVRR
jgi:hypothetical protein